MVSSIGSFLVERRFFLSWSRCPIVVCFESGKCFVIASAVKPGHVAKYPFFTAWIQVFVTYLKYVIVTEMGYAVNTVMDGLGSLTIT